MALGGVSIPVRTPGQSEAEPNFSVNPPAETAPAETAPVSAVTTPSETSQPVPAPESPVQPVIPPAEVSAPQSPIPPRTQQQRAGGNLFETDADRQIANRVADNARGAKAAADTYLGRYSNEDVTAQAEEVKSSAQELIDKRAAELTASLTAAREQRLSSNLPTPERQPHEQEARIIAAINAIQLPYIDSSNRVQMGGPAFMASIGKDPGVINVAPAGDPLAKPYESGKFQEKLQEIATTTNAEGKQQLDALRALVPSLFEGSPKTEANSELGSSPEATNERRTGRSEAVTASLKHLEDLEQSIKNSVEERVKTMLSQSFAGGASERMESALEDIQSLQTLLRETKKAIQTTREHAAELLEETDREYAEKLAVTQVESRDTKQVSETVTKQTSLLGKMTTMLGGFFGFGAKRAKVTA